MELSDVGMIEGGLDLDFVQESVRQAGISFESRQENLHGFDAVRENIPDLIALAHAAGAEDLDDFVVADALADVHDCPSPKSAALILILEPSLNIRAKSRKPGRPSRWSTLDTGTSAQTYCFRYSAEECGRCGRVRGCDPTPKRSAVFGNGLVWRN